MILASNIQSKTQTVAELVLAEITSASTPLTSGDLYERLDIDPDDTVIHAAIRALVTSDQIECAGVVPGRRNTPAKAYRLASPDARLMHHLESELAASADLDQGDIGTRCLVDDLDNAASSHNGDELHVIHAHIPCETATTLKDLADRHTDPVLRALTQMDTHPGLPDRQQHVDRLRALATHLDEGRPIIPQQDIVTWLFDLAATLEEMAA